jgi:hypothetical protein
MKRTRKPAAVLLAATLALSMAPVAAAAGTGASAAAAPEVAAEGRATARSSWSAEKVKEGYLFMRGVPEFLSQTISFNEGLAYGLDRATGSYYWVDTAGEVVVPSSLGYQAAIENDTSAGCFSEGLAGVYDPESGKWGFIDRSGELAIPYAHDAVGRFSEGKSVVLDFVVDEHGLVEQRSSVIDPSGSTLFTMGEYNFGPGYSEGLIGASYAVMEDESNIPLWGYLDGQGAWAIAPGYTFAEPFANGLAAVSRDQVRVPGKSTRYAFIDREGNEVIPEVVAPEHNYAFAYSDYVPYEDPATGLWGYYAKDGSVAAEPRYEQAGMFREGLAVVQRADGRWAVVGEDFAEAFSTDLALDASGAGYGSGLVRVQDPATGLWGYVDAAGAFAVPCAYAEALSFQNGVAWARDAAASRGVLLASDGSVLVDGVERGGYAATDDGHLWVRTADGGAGSPSAYDVYLLEERPFSDVAPGDWFAADVERAYELGYVGGVGGGLFEPGRAMTRAEFAAVVYKMAGMPPAAGAPGRFADIPAGHWSEAAVSWASSAGVVSGTGDGLFGPDGEVTREQIATMLYRYAGDGAQADPSVLDGFSDGGQASDWARSALAWAVERGYLKGKDNGSLDPKGTATRAEIATIAVRVQPESA